MDKKERAYTNPTNEDDEENDDDIDEIKSSVFRAILKNNRIMLRQNNQIIDQLEKMGE